MRRLAAGRNHAAVFARRACPGTRALAAAPSPGGERVPYGLAGDVWQSWTDAARSHVLEADGARPVTDAEFAEWLATLRARACREIGVPAGAGVVVAVSGGADSMALASLTAAWAASSGVRASGVVVDHSLRPESAEEAQRVAESATAMGLPTRVLRIGWGRGRGGDEHGTRRSRGPGGTPAWAVQAAGRKARAAALALAAAETGASCVLLGHHADDAAETVVMRAFRASGVAGMASMSDVTALPMQTGTGVALLRPFLGSPKQRLIATCGDRGALRHVAWDPSNDTAAYDRGRVRWALRLARAADPPLLAGDVVSLGALMRVARRGMERDGRGRAAASAAVVPDLGVAVVDARRMASPLPAAARATPGPAQEGAAGAPARRPRSGRTAALASGDALAAQEEATAALAAVMAVAGRDASSWRPVDKPTALGAVAEALAGLAPRGRRALTRGVVFEGSGDLRGAGAAPGRGGGAGERGGSEPHGARRGEEGVASLVLLPADVAMSVARLRASSLPVAEDAAVVVPGSGVPGTLWGRVRVEAWREGVGQDPSLAALRRIVGQGRQAGAGGGAASAVPRAEADRVGAGRVPEAAARADAGPGSRGERVRQTLRRHRAGGHGAAAAGGRSPDAARGGGSPPPSALTADERAVVATAGLLLGRAASAVELVHEARAVADDAAAAAAAALGGAGGADDDTDPSGTARRARRALDGAEAPGKARPAKAKGRDVAIGSFLSPVEGVPPLGLGRGLSLRDAPPTPRAASAAALTPPPGGLGSPAAPIPSKGLPCPGELARPVGEPFVLATDPDPGFPGADVLPRARRTAEWAVAASGRVQDQASSALLGAVQDALASLLPTRTDLTTVTLRALVPFACAAPVLVARTLSADGWSALQELLALPAQPFAVSTEATVGSAIVLSLVSSARERHHCGRPLPLHATPARPPLTALFPAPPRLPPLSRSRPCSRTPWSWPATSWSAASSTTCPRTRPPPLPSPPPSSTPRWTGTRPRPTSGSTSASPSRPPPSPRPGPSCASPASASPWTRGCGGT